MAETGAGDIAWGTEAMLMECEKQSLPYLFKIRQTTRVQRHIAGLFGRTDWEPAGAGKGCRANCN
jgi:hypothetical protein